MRLPRRAYLNEPKTLGCARQNGYFWCKHCGRQWKYDSVMMPHGSNDTVLVPLAWPWQFKDENATEVP